MKTLYDSFENMKKDREIKALIGISRQDFDNLLPMFEKSHSIIQQERLNRGEIRIIPKGGPTGNLKNRSMELFFILFYMKTYCTFDVLGTHFNFGSGNAHRHVKRLLPILRRALDELGMLPRQLPPSLDEFNEIVEPIQEIAIDGVECPIVRPVDYEVQKEFYSGKKKRHTIKSLIISDLNKFILFVSITVAGKMHDYELMKGLFNPKIPWFDRYQVFLDLGFLGAADDYNGHGNIRIPHKKPRKSKKNPNPSLTKQQKVENKKLASKRVAVEHAIGGMKHFYCLTHRIRNHLTGIINYFFQLSAGLWNLKIS